MQDQKLTALWEYSIGNRSTITENDLHTVCCMYLGANLPEDVKNTLRTKVTENFNSHSKNMLDIILRGGNSLADYLIDTSIALEKPKDSLKTILDDNLADEDDDSSVDENNLEGAEEEEETEEGKPAPVGLTILMRGFMKKKEDGKLEWSGNWAMTTEAFDSGDKAKFRFEVKGIDASTVEKDGKIVSLPAAPLIFEGSFLVKDETQPNGFIRIDEKNVKLEFEPAGELKWKLKGSGENINGKFTLEGELDGASRRMGVFKTYEYVKNEYASSEGSGGDDDDDIASGDDELDPDEIADLQADQQETYGEILGGETAKEEKKKAKPKEEEPAPADESSGKKKKRRMVDDDDE